jgi:hypothetical protein
MHSEVPGELEYFPRNGTKNETRRQPRKKESVKKLHLEHMTHR